MIALPRQAHDRQRASKLDYLRNLKHRLLHIRIKNLSYRSLKEVFQINSFLGALTLPWALQYVNDCIISHLCLSFNYELPNGSHSFINWCFLRVSADEEFDELCFEYGLELDEIVSNLKH